MGQPIQRIPKLVAKLVNSKKAFAEENFKINGICVIIRLHFKSIQILQQRYRVSTHAVFPLLALFLESTGVYLPRKT